MKERDVTAVLERAKPSYMTELGDWDAVLRDARSRRHPGAATAAALAAGVVVLALVALLWPFGDGEQGIVARALAAAGEGPVVHVILRGEWGGTLIDLDTDARTPVHAELEVWYDPERGLHQVGRYGGTVQYDIIWPPPKIPARERDVLSGIASGYRDALARGNARVVREGEVDGTPVYWIEVHTEFAREGRPPGTQEVAVSRETYEPLYIQESRDGTRAVGTGRRILAYETLPAGRGDFTVSKVNYRFHGLMSFGGGRSGITGAEARKALGAEPLWLGASFSGFRLLLLSRVEFRIAEPGVKAEGRPLSVPEWDDPLVEKFSGVNLFYGLLDEEGRPDAHQPNMRLTETLRAEPLVLAGASPYVPPDGRALITGDGHIQLRVGRVWVSIEASGPERAEVALAAARALRPMPG